MKIIDLFSGAGGFSNGFEQAGAKVAYGFDYQEKALETFQLNHKHGAKAVKVDLFDEKDVQRVIKLAKGAKPDGIIGGPPCQGFSLAGPRREDDPRNKLYYRMIRVAKETKPKFVVIENVPSLATLYKGVALKNIIGDLKNLGYHVKHKILKATDFGIPQIRRRLFVVAFKTKKAFDKFEFPKADTKSEDYLSVSDAISDLPLLGENAGSLISDYTNRKLTPYQKMLKGKSNKLYNHQNSNHKQKTVDMLKLIKEGKNAKSLPEQFRKDYTYNDALTRLHSKKPSRTIDTGHRTVFHPTENRVPSVREAARIQSFPDEFVFCGSKAAQYRQVGNAVPPLLAKKIALKIKEALND